MKSQNKLIDKYLLAICFIVSIPATLALFHKGFYGASDDVHIAWLYEMFTTLKLGQFPPRFVPDLSFGYGYPLFNFVFPLPYYIGSLFHLIGLSLVNSTKFVFFLTIPLSFLFMYKLLRQYCDQLLSFVGSFIYVYTPYRATDIYVRGAIGEILAFVLLPLILLTFMKITSIESKADKIWWIALGALSLGLLILTHNIVSYMFIPFALLYVVFIIFTQKQKRKALLTIILTVIVGLMISAYFWIPALLESGLMKYETVFNFWDHFPTLKQLIVPYFGYGASVPGPYDGMSFFVGLSNWLLVIISTVVLILTFKKIGAKDKVLLLWSLTTFVISIFMMNYRSSFIWQTIPLLPYFQFPWRFMTLTTLTTPLMIVSLKYFNYKYAAILLVLLVIPAFAYFRPQDYLERNDSYFLAKYIPYPATSSEYYTQTEEYLRLPITSTERPRSLSPGFSSGDQNSLNIFNITLTRLGGQAKITTNTDVLISFGKYYFPGWIVEDNNKQIQSTGSAPYGQITFNLKGAGTHIVKVYFQETPLRLFCDIVSFIAFAGVVLVIFKPHPPFLRE